jgi:hypothetical protein
MFINAGQNHNILVDNKSSENVTVFKYFVLYGHETWSLTIMEEHKLRIFEIRVLRRIFGPKREEVTGGWSRLHNEELYNLYTSPNIIRTIKSRG